MDVDWCLTCGRQTNEGNEAYCSKACMLLDRIPLPESHSISLPSRRRSFDVPSVSPPRHTHTHTHTHTHKPQTRGANARIRAVNNAFPLGQLPSNARFRDDELQDGPSTLVAGKWTGKDREGILVWAHSISPGLDEGCTLPDADASSLSDLAVLATFRLTRPPPFPLTAQNLAPPCVTIPPRHVLLNHTSMHSPSHNDDREPTLRSLSQDDASLLTPATESVITPSAPDTTPLSTSKSAPLVGRLVNKVCSWIASPRATPEGNPTAPSVTVHSTDSSAHPSAVNKTDRTRSSAIGVAGTSRPRVRACELFYDDDAA